MRLSFQTSVLVNAGIGRSGGSSIEVHGTSAGGRTWTVGAEVGSDCGFIRVSLVSDEASGNEGYAMGPRRPRFAPTDFARWLNRAPEAAFPRADIGFCDRAGRRACGA